MGRQKKSISHNLSEKKFGTKFVSGGDKPMERMLKQAKKLNHKLTCSLWEKSGNYTSYWFGSYMTIQDFENGVKDEQVYSMFEIIPTDIPVKIFFDVEWLWEWCADEDVIWNRVIEAYNVAIKKCGLDEVDVDDFCITTASDMVKYGSLHLYNIHQHLNRMENHRNIVDAMYSYMVENANDYFYIEDGKIKCIVDGSVYSDNQQMRLYKAHKLKDGEFVRPFKGIDDGDVILEDTIITHQKDVSDDITVQTEKLKHTGIRLRKQQQFPDEVVEKWCDGLDDETKKIILKQVCCNNVKNVKYEPTSGIDMYEALVNILPRLSDERAHETNDWRNVVKACAYYCGNDEGLTLALRFAKRDEYWTKLDGQEATVKKYEYFVKSEVIPKYEPIALVLKMLREDVGNGAEYYAIKRKYLVNEQKYIERMLIAGNDLELGTLYHKYHKDSVKWGTTGAVFFYCSRKKLWIKTDMKDGLGETREDLQRFISSKCSEIANGIMMKTDRLNEIMKNREQYTNEPSDEVLTAKIEVLQETVKKLYKVSNSVKSLFCGLSCLKSILHLYKDDNFEENVDREPDELPIKNGRVIRLDNRQVRPRCKKDLWTYELDVEYIKSDYSTIVKFINNITLNDKEYTDYFQKLIGYCFTGRIDDRAFYIAHGNTSNGKSSFLGALLNKILKSGYANCSEDAFAVKKDSKGAGRATPEIIPLMKARVAVYNEPEEEVVLNQGRLKAITGGDKLSGRELFKKQIEFKCFCKPFILCNPLPKCNMDKAMKNRIRLLPFNASFDLSDSEQRNWVEDLVNNKTSEAFSWFVDGAVLWYKDKKLTIPKVCMKDIGQYIQECDTIESFIKDECEVDESYYTPPQFLYDKYKEYCESNCKLPHNLVAFGVNLNGRYERQRITKDSKRLWAYMGIRYKNDVVVPPTTDENK